MCTPEYIADRAAEVAKEVGLEIEILDPAGLKARGYEGCLRVGTGSAHPPRMVILRHVPRKASQGDRGPGRQGHHLRHRRHQPQARRPHVGDEGRHGGRGRGALRHARAGPHRPRRQGGGHPLLRGELPRRQRAAAGRHLHGQERQVHHGRQHRRRGPPRPHRRPAPRGRGGRHPRRGHRDPDRRLRARARARAWPACWAPTATSSAASSAPARTTARPSGSCPWSRSTATRSRRPTPTSTTSPPAAWPGPSPPSLFLREFVPKGVAWAHLDIAGPMFKDKDWKYYEAGALGFGVKTLVDLSERFHDPVP